MRHKVTRLVLLHAVLHDAVAQRGAHAADEYRLVALHDPHQLLDVLKTPAARRFLLIREIVNVFLIPLHGAPHLPPLGKESNLPQLAQIAFVPVDHHRPLGGMQCKVQPVRPHRPARAEQRLDRRAAKTGQRIERLPGQHAGQDVCDRQADQIGQYLSVEQIAHMRQPHSVGPVDAAEHHQGCRVHRINREVVRAQDMPACGGTVELLPAYGKQRDHHHVV